MHVSLFFYIDTYVDLLVKIFSFYQFNSLFLQRIQCINANGMLHGMSLCSKLFSEKEGSLKVEIGLRIVFSLAD